MKIDKDMKFKVIKNATARILWCVLSEINESNIYAKNRGESERERESTVGLIARFKIKDAATFEY